MPKRSRETPPEQSGGKKIEDVISFRSLEHVDPTEATVNPENDWIDEIDRQKAKRQAPKK